MENLQIWKSNERTNAFRKGAMPKNIIVSKGNINYILKLSIVHHEEHYFLLRFARISFTRSFTFHFIVKIKLSRGRKNRIRCSWREKKKREKERKGKILRLVGFQSVVSSSCVAPTRECNAFH